MFYFNSQNFKKSKEKSFTLLEVLMAVFILTTAVGASYVLFQKVFIASSLTQSKLIAYYLAQEGIENIRNIRDSNWLNGVSWTDEISGQETEYVNFLDGSSSNFERIVSTSLIDEDTMEVKINIKWNEKGRDYNVEAINHLYNWYSEEEGELTCEEWCTVNYPTYTDALCTFPGPLVCAENQANDGQLNCGSDQICVCCYP